MLTFKVSARSRQALMSESQGPLEMRYLGWPGDLLLRPPPDAPPVVLGLFSGYCGRCAPLPPP